MDVGATEFKRILRWDPPHSATSTALLPDRIDTEAEMPTLVHGDPQAQVALFHPAPTCYPETILALDQAMH